MGETRLRKLGVCGAELHVQHVLGHTFLVVIRRLFGDAKTLSDKELQSRHIGCCDSAIEQVTTVTSGELLDEA